MLKPVKIPKFDHGELDLPPEKLARLTSKLSKSLRQLSSQHTIRLQRVHSARIRLLGSISYTVSASMMIDGKSTDSIIHLIVERFRGYGKIDISCQQQFYHVVSVRKTNMDIQSRIVFTSAKDATSNKEKVWTDVGDIMIESLSQLGKLSNIYFSLSKINCILVHQTDRESKYVVKAKLLKPNMKVINCECQISQQQPEGRLWTATIRCQKRTFNIVKNCAESGDFTQINANC